MKNKLFLSILVALGLASAPSQGQQTVTFVDVSNLGEGVNVISSGGTVKVNATVLSKNQRWTRDRVYILANNVIVPNGITLTIEPGTLIRAEQATIGQGSGAEAALTPADPGALVVARGGRLVAAGTAAAPIIFTSIDDPNVPGGEATIPPSENLGSGGSVGSVTTVTNNSTTNRYHTITNTTTSNITITKVTNSSGGLSTNTVLTPGQTHSFTNYAFTTNNNYFRLNGSTTNWYEVASLVSTYTNLAAARTLKTGAAIVTLATNDLGRAGLYTATGGELTASARGYGTTWTASADSAWKHDGLWGGIVLCGKGTVNRGYGAIAGSLGTNANSVNITEPSIDPATGVVSGSQRGVQLVEGMAGFSAYSWGGGDTVNPPDDSGILRFVSNRYGGFVIAQNAELNSYSFYGVGRNTVLEFLEAWNNADDDYEFWGGDVGMRYALSMFCGDDGFDTDQGYLGAVQYYVQIQNNAVGNDTGSSFTGRATANYGDSLTENDGPESSNEAVPFSTYILANATLVGRGYGSLGSWNSLEPFMGPNFRDNGGARWHNTIIMDNPHGAVLITDRFSTTNADANSATNGTSIGRYNGTRQSGGFDGAGRAADLSASNTGASDAPDGRFHSCVFFRNGLAANSGADGEVGKYSNNADFRAAVTNDPTGYYVASSDNLFPTFHSRNGRGASNNGDTNRANTASVLLQLTNAANYNTYNANPGLNINPFTRTSGLNLRPTAGAARTLANSAIPGVRGLNTNATFAGAVLDNAWMKGWTISDTLGLWETSDTFKTRLPQGLKVEPNGAHPKVSFTAEANIAYVVERSTDNKKFEPVVHVPAAGSSALVEVPDSSATIGTTPVFYRVLAL